MAYSSWYMSLYTMLYKYAKCARDFFEAFLFSFYLSFCYKTTIPLELAGYEMIIVNSVPGSIISCPTSADELFSSQWNREKHVQVFSPLCTHTFHKHTLHFHYIAPHLWRWENYKTKWTWQRFKCKTEDSIQIFQLCVRQVKRVMQKPRL